MMLLFDLWQEAKNTAIGEKPQGEVREMEYNHHLEFGNDLGAVAPLNTQYSMWIGNYRGLKRSEHFYIFCEKLQLQQQSCNIILGHISASEGGTTSSYIAMQHFCLADFKLLLC